MTEYRVDRSKHPAPGYVAVGRETVEDLGLGSKTGKARAVAGAPHLPGSSFGRPRHDRTFGRHAVAGEQRSRHEAETHLSATTRRYHLAVANSNPSVNAAVGTLRQTKSEGNIEPYSNDGAYKFEAEHVASLRGRAAGDEVYDYRKHSWYHDVTRRRIGVSRPNAETEEWAQAIKKSKDHIGYGNGMIGYGDVQATSLASDAPQWMFGVRMVPGVVGSGMPRWQYSMVEEDPRAPGKAILNIQKRYFQRGPNLSTIENVGLKPPPGYKRNDRGMIDYRQPLPVSNKVDVNRVSDKRVSGMTGTGAIVKPVVMPPSNHHSVEPDFRVFSKVERY